jgi:hypothetical protein
MKHEHFDRVDQALDGDADPAGGPSRRSLIAAAASGFVAAAHGLRLPTGSGDALARSHKPVDRVREHKDQRRRKQRNQHKRKRRARHSTGSRTKAPNDKPRGQCIFKPLDMQLIFQAGTKLTHVMTVSMGDPNRGDGYVVHWKDQSVAPGQEYRFVGWYPGMYLEVTSRQPAISFEAVNGCVGFPWVDIHKRDGTNERDSRILKQGFDVNEKVSIDGFSIERIPDGEFHKIFIIKALD